MAMTETSRETRTAAEVVAAVRAKEFAEVRRGYDKDQVRGFLVEMARAIEVVEERRQHAKRELESARAELARARETTASPVDPFEQAGTHVTEILRSVSAEAEAMRRDAAAAAERARSEARAQSDEMLREAMQELAAGRDMLLQEMEGARHRVSAILERLSDALRTREANSPERREEPATPSADESSDAPLHDAGEGSPDSRQAAGDVEWDEPPIEDEVEASEPEPPPAYLQLFSGQLGE